ncbi:unnamed protein product [Closterium sp. NIES-54]
MASLRVLPFDPEGRPVAFDTWHDDLQLYLLRDSRDSVSLFDHVSDAAPAPPATADVSTRSQWLSRDATARLAIRNHLPATECAHFGGHMTAQTLYNAVVARYSSPATAAIGRLLLPYLFPELLAFATVADLVTHLRTSDGHYRTAAPAEFLLTNQPPMFITLYFIVTRLSDSLRSVKDHFLTLDPTSLTVDLLEQHLLTAEASAVAVGAARGTPRSPFFEGCSPSPLSSSFASAAVADVSVPEDIGAASTSTKRRNSKGKGGRGSGGGSGGGGGGSGSGSGGSGRGGGGGGGSCGGGGGSGGSGGSGGGGTSGGRSGPQHGGPGGGRGQQQQRRSETQMPQQLSELLRSGVAIFDLDFDVIIFAMYALSFSAEGDCYWCVPPDPGIAAAALGASASGTPPGTAPAEALHTFTLDSGASRCFFRDSTTLTPLPAPVPVSSPPLVLYELGEYRCLQDAMVTTTTPGGQRVSICTCTRTGRHLAMFTRRPGLSQVAASCSCRLLLHQTLLWHHRLGHPSLPCLHGMHSRLLVSGLPRSLPPLPPPPAPPCLPCVEGQQRAAPHSSSFPPTTAPLQTLHIDVWGPARVSGQGRERYFLLVVDVYTGYTTVFPLSSKGEVSAVLIPWIRIVRLELRERLLSLGPTPTILTFSSDLLRDFCRGEGIRQSFMLSDSPQQNGIAERRIGLVMEVARTSMIHAAAPHFLWPFAVRYAAHQLNLWPRVSLPETSPTLRWTGKVGDVSVFWVWGSCSFVRDTSADKLSARAIPCRLFPYRSAPSPPPPLFLAPGPPSVDPLPPQGPAPSGVSQVDPLPGTAPVQVAVFSGAAPGAPSGGAASGRAQPGGARSEGAGSGGAEPEGVEPGGAESEGVEPEGLAGASPRLSSQQLREWLVQRPRRRSGAPGAGEPGDAGAGGAAVTTGAGDPTELGATGDGGAGVGVARVGGPGAGSAGAAGAGAVDPGAGGAGGIVRPCPYFVPLLHQVLGVPSSTSLPPPFLCPPPDQSQPPLQPASPLPVPSPYTELSGGLTQRRELASRPVSPVCTARRAPRLRPPPVPGTHTMTLRPSSVPLRFPVPAPPESSLPKVPDPESDRARAVSPTVARLLATAVTDSSFESAAASALVAELLDFATTCRLDYASALVAESVPPSPPVKQPPGSPPAFKARYVARSFSQRHGVDYFQTFSPTPKMTTLWVLLHVAAQRDYELHSLDFNTAFLQGSLHEEIWLRRPLGFTGSFPTGTRWSLRRPVYGLRQAPRDWHDTLRTTLAALVFVPSTADPSLFLRTNTSLPPFYVLVYVDDLVFAMADIGALTLITRDRARCTITLTQSHMVHQVLQRFGFQYSSPQLTPLSTSHSLSAPPSDESVEPSGPYLELVGCLITSGMGLVLGGRGPVVLIGHADASWELRWLTYLLTDLGEQPHSPPVMIALCEEHRVEHKTKHIALRYFLARELQQRGQFCLAYMATRANTADFFTKTLPPGDHQRFVTVLGIVPTSPHLLTA